MNLELIPHEACPVCGDWTASESCRNRHSNGQGFEERTFQCGCTYRWSPNSERLENPVPCPHSPASRALEAKRRAAKVTLLTAVVGLDVDDTFKATASYAIDSIR